MENYGEYILPHTSLNLNLKKQDEKKYNMFLLNCIILEFKKRGYIVDKIYSTTSRGTQIKYKKVINFDEAKNKLMEIAKQYNFTIKFLEGKK